MSPTIFSTDYSALGGTADNFAPRRIANIPEFNMPSRIMTTEEVKAGKRSAWFRFNLLGPVRNFPRNVCCMTYITTLVIKNNNLERLPPELGNLVNLVHIDASCNRLKELPTTVGDLTDMQVFALNSNQLSDLPLEMGRLVNLRMLNLYDNQLPQRLHDLYGEGNEQDIRRLLRHLLDSYYRNNVNSTPPLRQWRTTGKASKDGFRFTLLCYNVLSANYATTAQYPYCPTWAIEWDYRRRGILEELRHYAPSLICLQEIDTDQFEAVFVPELAKMGYDGVFLAKSRTRTMESTISRKVDGCAIFWLTEKFSKISEFHHEFMLSCSSVSVKTSAVLLNRVMTRDNIAIDVILETKGAPDSGGGRKLCISTGHIHWDPEHSDVKLIQTIMWTAELWAHLEEVCGAKTAGAASCIPVVFCGDFNSLPASGVVEFLSQGAVPKSHVEFLDHGHKYLFEDWKLLENWANDGDILRHRFNFDRAYLNGEADGMKLTNMTYDFKGIIDYIFYTRQHFRLLGSLDQIPEEWFLQERILGCPHIHVPSDHFPLLVELDMLSQPHRTGGLAISDPDASTPDASSSSAAATNPKAGASTPGKKQGGAGKQR